jgi:hypothetical protein
MIAYLITFGVGLLIWLIFSLCLRSDYNYSFHYTKKERRKLIISIGSWCVSAVLWASLAFNLLSLTHIDGPKNYWNLTESLILLGSSVVLLVGFQTTKNKKLYLKFNNKKKIKKANPQQGDLISVRFNDGSYYNGKTFLYGVFRDGNRIGWEYQEFGNTHIIKEIKIIKTKSQLQWEEEVKDLRYTSNNDIILTL